MNLNLRHIAQQARGQFNGMAARFSRKQLLWGVGGLLLLAAAVLVLVIWTGNRPEKPSFAPYTSNQGGFTVEVPDGSMQLQTSVDKFAGSSVTRFFHSTENPFGVFTVVHFDLPPGVVTPSERNNIFNLLATDFILGFNGVITQTSNVEINGSSGIRVKAAGHSTEKEIISEVMVLMVSNRIYLIGAYGDRQVLKPKYISHFLQSFRFNF